MNEQWKCPQCETLCTGNFCPICGFNHANLVENTETFVQQSAQQQNGASQDRLSQQGGYQVPPRVQPGNPTPPIPPAPPRPPIPPAPPKPPIPTPPKDPKASKAKKGKKLGLIIAACVVGVIALAAILLCVIPANDYQSIASTLIEKCSSDESNIQKFLEKGDQAIKAEDYDKAEFFYEDKVLALNSQNQDAMIGLLRISMAQSDKDAVVIRLNEISVLSASITNINKEYIVDAVDSLEVSDYEQLKSQLQNQQATIDDVVQVMNHYENYWMLFGFDEIQTDMVDKYLECYDIANSNNYDITFEEQLLNDALTRFPENEQLLSRQQDLVASKVENAKNQIDTALANGDVDQAKQWYDELCAISSEDNSAYANKISEYETRVSFLSQARDLLGQSDYDGLRALIDSDSGYNGSTYYLVDGKYVDSVENGNGVIYDVNGIYVGDIVNNQRSGNGKQLLYYTNSERYLIAEGAWQNNALNGEASVSDFTEDNTLITTTGNFTDGYENGTMTVKWHDSYDWSATYKAEMGDYVDAKEDSDGYHYAYASNNEMQAWLYAFKRDGHGFWVN